MALELSDMLLKLSPMSGLSGGAGHDSSMERKRLQLMREQFENEKRQQAERNRLSLLAEQGEMARARMANERQKAKADATMAAQLQKDKLAAYTEFTKLNGEGNIEGARAMVPMMSALGMGVNLEGEGEGLPRYRVDMDAQEAAGAQAKQELQASPRGPNESALQSLNRLSVLGIDGETGGLDAPAGIQSSDEVDPVTGQSVGDRVMAAIGNDTGKPLRGPDETDYTGGVPKNVIDLGATQAATEQRLGPLMAGLAEAYPDKITQDSARSVAAGLSFSGLPGGKQLDAFDKAMGGPTTQRNTQISAAAQAERFRETRDDLTEKDKAQMRQDGRRGADELAQRDDIPGGVKALRTIDEIEDLLTDDSPENDTMVAGALLSIQDVKGIPSDKDLAMAFGMDKASTITQVLDYIGTKVKGGFQPEQRAAILSFMKRVGESQKQKIFGYLESTRNLGDYNDHERQGYEGRAKRAVPGYLYNEWLDTHKDEGPSGDAKGGGAGGSTDFDAALDEQAKGAGLDANKIRAVIRHESGGKADAKSVAGAAGVFQLMGDRAQEVGTSSEDLLEMSPAEQVPYGIKYLKNTGLKGDAPPRDYALAFAAPGYMGKSDDTVVAQYKKGSKRGDQVRAQNPGWVPKDGSDITVGSILSFYGLDGDKGKAEPKTAGAKAAEPAKLPEPTTPEEKRVQELLLKARGG